MKQHQIDIEEKISYNLGKGLSIHEALCKLTQGELYSLLLPVIEDKVSSKSPAILAQENKNNKFITPSSISQKDFLVLDNICIDIVGNGYNSVDLSPVAILGSNQITGTSQNKILSSIRGLELVGDGCIQLAYYHVSQKNAYQDVDYISSHRVLRNQNFDNSEYTNHFRILNMGSHIRSGDILKHIDKMVEHVEYLVKILNELKKQKIIDFNNISIEFGNLNNLNHVNESTRRKLVDNLQQSKKQLRANIVSSVEHQQESGLLMLGEEDGGDFDKLNYAIQHSEFLNSPGIDISVNKNRIAGLGHYDSYCYSIFMDKGDKRVSVADGGITNWTGKLLSNEKAAFVVAGLGTEILLKFFKFEKME